MIDPKKPYRTRSGHGDIKLFDVLDGRVYGAHRSAADLGWTAETWDVVTGRFDIADRPSGLDLVEIAPAGMPDVVREARALQSMVADGLARNADSESLAALSDDLAEFIIDAGAEIEKFAAEEAEAARQYRNKPACVDRAED